MVTSSPDGEGEGAKEMIKDGFIAFSFRHLLRSISSRFEDMNRYKMRIIMPTKGKQLEEISQEQSVV